MGQLFGVTHRGSVEEGDELVAAEPCGQIATGRRADCRRLRDSDEELVAGGMAVGLVDDLEAVEVDEEECRAGRTGCHHHSLDLVGEVQAAPQPGQHIGVGLADQTLRPHSDPLGPGGEDLRDHQPDGECQEESHAEPGVPRPLHEDPGRSGQEAEQWTDAPRLGQSDVDEDQGEEGRVDHGPTAAAERREGHLADRPAERGNRAGGASVVVPSSRRSKMRSTPLSLLRWPATAPRSSCPRCRNASVPITIRQKTATSPNPSSTSCSPGRAALRIRELLNHRRALVVFPCGGGERRSEFIAVPGRPLPLLPSDRPSSCICGSTSG